MDGSTTVAQYPVVLRYEGIYPHHLARYEAHRLRRGGDLNHVDHSRTYLNGPPLIGGEDWAAQALFEIKDMAAKNFAAELDALEKRKRRKDIERRLVEGPKQPWRPTRHGPMREVILTANKDWFAGDLSAFFGENENQREKAFGEYAVAWLKKHFGDDVIHARADRDEAAYHIHAVIMPRAKVEITKPNAKTPTASATRWMLQPSIHPMIEDYEAAQDSVGQWFADLGLVRGERRAAAIKQARANGTTPPKRRYHAKTWQWRAEQEQRILAEKKALAERTAQVEAREAEAETVLAVAEGVAAGEFVADTECEVPTLKEAPSPTAAGRSSPSLDALRKRSPAGFARAASVFARAWRRMFGNARAEAEALAQRSVAEAVAEIAEADEKIAEATLHLPSNQRSVVAKIRRTIPSILRRLERRPEGTQRGDKPDDRGPKIAGGEEKY